LAFEELWNAPAWLQEDTEPDGVLLDELNWPFCWLTQLPDIILVAMAVVRWGKGYLCNVQNNMEIVTMGGGTVGSKWEQKSYNGAKQLHVKARAPRRRSAVGWSLIQHPASSSED